MRPLPGRPAGLSGLPRSLSPDVARHRLHNTHRLRPLATPPEPKGCMSQERSSKLLLAGEAEAGAWGGLAEFPQRDRTPARARTGLAPPKPEGKTRALRLPQQTPPGRDDATPRTARGRLDTWGGPAPPRPATSAPQERGGPTARPGLDAGGRWRPRLAGGWLTSGQGP